MKLPEIIVDGKSSSMDRIDPNVVTFIMQAVTAGHTAKMRKMEEEKMPVGHLSTNLSLTGGTLYKYVIDYPLISFSISNDGPGLIRFKINQLEGGIDKEAPVAVNRVVSFDFQRPFVEKIFFLAEADSNITLQGLKGRKWE